MSSVENKRNLLREGSFVEPEIKNPFVHKLTIPFKDKIKIGVNSILLLPVRVISISILTLIASSLAVVITYGLSEKDINDQPFTGWRFLGRAIAFCFGFHHIKKNGKRATRNEAAIFVCGPHSTFLDAFVFFVLGLPSAVSRVENARIPFIGALVRAAQPILVQREDHKNKLQVINEIKKRSAPNADWPQLVIFPEGTTTNRSCLITFKPGAFIPGVAVQPVVVEYKNKLDTVTWTWEGLNAYQIIFLTLCQFNNYMEITYLDVYKPNENEIKDAKMFARNVRQKIADKLGVLTTDHTFEDCRLMLEARKLNLPFEAGLIEFEKIKEKSNINYENCKIKLQEFTTYARKSDGKMTLNQFCSYLELPNSDAVKKVFKMYDRNGDGLLDFREFLISFSIFSKALENTEETLKLAFSMFDKEGKGYISLSDLQSILYSAFSMGPSEVEILFKKVDAKNDGLITFDELKSYAEKKPEYAKIFLIYNGFNEFDVLENVVSYERIAESAKTRAETEPEPDSADGLSPTNIPTSDTKLNTLLKRPTTERSNSFDQDNQNETEIKSDNSLISSTISNHDLTKVE